MKTIAIHQKENWYLVNLPGYSNIPRKKIKVNVTLSDDEIVESDYKTLRGSMIMERYLEKEARSIVQEETIEFAPAFDELFGTKDIQTPDDLLTNI